MRITSWLLLLCLVHGEQISKRSSSALLRQRRRILDMDILMAISNKKDTQQRSLKKSQEDDCNTGDYLMDLFHCGGDKEMSMSMAVPSASPPTIPLPPVAPVPTISITFEPTTAPFALCRSQDRSQAIVAAVRKEFPDPNGEAIDWLIFQDPAQLDPCTDDLLQRYALVSFYFQTNGASWTDNAQWLSAASECSWTGISCTANDSVQILSLPGNNLVGPFPGELPLLTDLEALNVFRNELSGTIPDLMGLTSLASFDVEENALTGNAFANAGLPSMTVYRVSSNDLTGVTPDEIFTENLKELWFADNNIEGEIPASIGGATQLTSIILYGNNLIGQIPGSIGELTSLEQFQGYDNNFSGPLPPGLFVSSSLRDLRLEQNLFTGTIPADIGIVTALLDLRIGENSFTGTLPSEISMLSNLGFAGTIVDDFGSFSSLEFMDLSSNQLSGTLPSSVFTTPIDFLYLSDNMLEGTIPSNFAQATDLEDLYLFNNMLSGTVPAIADGELSRLTELRIENNEIEGTMPDSICALTGDMGDENRLVTLISDCGGPIPQIRCDCCNACINSP